MENVFTLLKSLATIVAPLQKSSYNDLHLCYRQKRLSRQNLRKYNQHKNTLRFPEICATNS